MDQYSDIQLSDLLGAGDEATAQKRAASLAAVLRQQQAQAQQQEFLGGLGSVFGAPRAGVGKAYADMGAQNYEGAQQALQQIPKVAEVRLQRAIEKQRADQQAKFQGEEMALKRQEVNQHRFGTIAPGGQVYDTRTGQLGEVGDVPKPPPVGRGGASGPLGAFDKLARPIRDDLDPSSGRGAGLFGKDQGLVTAAEKVLALTDDGKGGRNFNLTVRQVPELVQSVGAMLSGGNATAQAQLEHLMPKSWGSSAAERLEYLSGHPQDAQLGAFVKQYVETAEREKHLAQKRIRDVQLRRLPYHQGIYAQYPAETKALIKQYLPELGDDELDAAIRGAYKAPEPVAPSEGGLAPDKKKRLEELRKKAAEARK